MSVERERERDRSPEKHSDFKVFVGGISWHTTDQELADTFTKYAQGPVDARVMLDRITNRSRGFGFVTFENKEDMEECIAKLHATELDGRKISVTKAIPQSDIAPGAPASAIHGGYRGGRDRHRGDYGSRYDRPERAHSRGYDRPPPRGYDRGYGGGYDRAPYPDRGYGDRGYDRGYPGEYDRGYDRGYPPSGYGGGGYDRGHPDPYGYPPKDPYTRDAYGYEEAPPSYGYSDRGGYGAAYTRGGPITDRYNGGDRYSGAPERSAGAAVPLERSPDRYGRAPAGGPDRDYAAPRYSGNSRPSPYERSGEAPGRAPPREAPRSR
ncbi:probable cold-inducible RNA-binding protein at N-terminal half [Coccomyxa sp. Obi]|nr:probable cold-inducible RNA-binding protein at N-terminal half [Coccomyxa sp. Obi]